MRVVLACRVTVSHCTNEQSNRTRVCCYLRDVFVQLDQSSTDRCSYLPLAFRTYSRTVCWNVVCNRVLYDLEEGLTRVDGSDLQFLDHLSHESVELLLSSRDLT